MDGPVPARAGPFCIPAQKKRTIKADTTGQRIGLCVGTDRTTCSAPGSVIAPCGRWHRMTASRKGPAGQNRRGKKMLIFFRGVPCRQWIAVIAIKSSPKGFPLIKPTTTGSAVRAMAGLSFQAFGRFRFFGLTASSGSRRSRRPSSFRPDGVERQPSLSPSILPGFRAPVLSGGCKAIRVALERNIGLTVCGVTRAAKLSERHRKLFGRRGFLPFRTASAGTVQNTRPHRSVSPWRPSFVSGQWKMAAFAAKQKERSMVPLSS